MPYHPTDPDFTEEYAMEQYKKGMVYNENSKLGGYWICVGPEHLMPEYRKAYKVIGTTIADDGDLAGYVRAYCNTLEQALIFIEMCGGCGIDYPYEPTSQDKLWLVNYDSHIFWERGSKSNGIADGISTSPEFVEDAKTGIKVKISGFGRYQSPPYER